jgi:crotonobetainyl-CoA:carnitine CoA-transferase CaiB-like acyl-CoA transferase
VKQQHPTGGEVTTVRNPIRLSNTPIEYRHAPPLRAQHTQEVLRELLSISSEEIHRLVAQQVIDISPPLTQGI